MRQKPVFSWKFTGLIALVVGTLLVSACQPAAQATQSVPVTGKTAEPTAASTKSGSGSAASTSTAVPTIGAFSTVTDTVTVQDQAIQNGSVKVARVTSIAGGWIVIHADDNGKPGDVLGYAPVKAGENKDVVVKIDVAKATPKLYAMLHKDDGKAGTFEFPGADAPVMIDGNPIAPSFKVTGGGAASGSTSGTAKSTPTAGATATTPAAATATAPTAAPTTSAGTGASTGASSNTPANAPQEVKLMVRDSQSLGKYLVDEKGMTLYLFTKDSKGSSACEGGCLELWPPLLVAKGGKVTVDDATAQSKVGTITRSDGSTQVTYNDFPLYYYAKDTKPGDATGQAVNGNWFVVAP